MQSACGLCNQQSTGVMVTSVVCRFNMTTIIAVKCAQVKQVWLDVGHSMCALAACLSTALRCCCLRPSGYCCFWGLTSGSFWDCSGNGQVASHLKCTPSSAQQCLAPESGLHSHTLGALAPVPPGTKKTSFLSLEPFLNSCMSSWSQGHAHVLCVCAFTRCDQNNV